MNKNKKPIDVDMTKIIARRKRNFIILSIILAFVSFKLSQFIITVIIPELQQLIDCKHGIIAYSDCKYTGLASIIAAPWIIVFLIASIIIAILLCRKKQTINQFKRIDTTTNVALYFSITLCIIMALFTLSTIIYGVVAWIK